MRTPGILSRLNTKNFLCYFTLHSLSFPSNFHRTVTHTKGPQLISYFFGHQIPNYLKYNSYTSLFLYRNLETAGRETVQLLQNQNVHYRLNKNTTTWSCPKSDKFSSHLHTSDTHSQFSYYAELHQAASSVQNLRLKLCMNFWTPHAY